MRGVFQGRRIAYREVQRYRFSVAGVRSQIDPGIYRKESIYLDI